MISPTKEDFELALQKSVDYLKNESRVYLIILFGSYSRGDYSLRHSDIDLYLLMDGEKDSHLERNLWKEVNAFSPKIQIHLNFEYKNLNPQSSLLRYNVLKEGKILYERQKSIFLKKDFDLEEVFLVKLDLKNLKPNEKYNLKRTLTKTHSATVYFYDGRTIVIAKDFLFEFEKILAKKKVGYKLEFEFLYRKKKDFDEIN